MGAFEPCVDAARGLVQQVRPTDIAHEDEVPGEDVAGFGADGAVGDQEGDVLRRMHHFELDVSQRDTITVDHACGIRESGAVLPVGSPFCGDVHRGAGAGGELASAREVVRVDVGLGDGGDRHAVPVCDVEVDLYVAARVDDGGFAGLLATDEIARMGEVVVLDAF